jgi:hypothetical protein
MGPGTLFGFRTIRQNMFAISKLSSRQSRAATGSGLPLGPDSLELYNLDLAFSADEHIIHRQWG